MRKAFGTSIFLIVGGLALTSFWKWVGASFVNDVPAAASKLLVSLIVITVFIERSMAAINAVIFQPHKRELKVATREMESTLLLYTSGNKEFVYSADGIKLASEISKTRRQLAAIAGEEDKNRVTLGFAIALLVSAAGVRSLSSLLQIDPVNGAGGLSEEFQRYLAHIVDIVLTAGLIAGGSDGLAKLLQIIKDGMTQQPKPLQ